MANLRINTAVNGHQQLEYLLAQQAEIQAQINAILPSSAPAPSFPHHRSPIHKQHHQQQQQQRRSSNNVPRSMSSNGTSMARHLSSDRIEPVSRSRTLSQQSTPSMARTNSKGPTSARTGNLPFLQIGKMPPPLLSESRRENSVEAWASHDQPFTPYNFSHQPQPMQRSMSQQKPGLEQVPELDSIPGENPGDFLYRTGVTVTPILQLPPSPITIPTSTQLRHRFSTSSRASYNTPTTPTSESLTTATTLSMSRQNSLCTDAVLESMQMMKFNSNTSFSTDVNPVDHTLYDQVTPYPSSRHSRRSSNEEQSQLLVGAGGASHDSQFSHSFPSADAVAQFHSSGSFGEKMEKSQSNESTSSLSSTTSSRSKQRLQAQIAAARPLMPKGGSDDHAMSRDCSSQSMMRLESKDGSQDKIAISKPTYQRPKHDRVYCKQCEDHPDGFRGEHELRRHEDRQHKLMVKKWVCVQPQSGLDHPKPVVPLSRCKACQTQKKKYGAYYNAAAHLRRAHFRPKAKGRTNKSKAEDAQKRGGKGGGDWPSMAELKFWMMEVEEPATDYPLTASQQQDADDSDDETFDIDEQLLSPHTLGSISSGSFDTSFAMSDASFNIYPSPASSELFGMQNMQPDLPSSHQKNIDSSMNFTSSQTSFDNFPVSFMNDQMAFLEQSSLPQLSPFNDQSFGLLDPVNFSYI